MENLDLQEIRKKLDGIDNQLVELFEKRMALCSDVAEFKIQTGKKVYDGERERQKLDSMMAMADSEFNKKGVYELFSQIMTIWTGRRCISCKIHGRCYGGSRRGKSGLCGTPY